MSWQDIDQLTRIMLLVGKPSEALLEKMGSDEVSLEKEVSFVCPSKIWGSMRESLQHFNLQSVVYFSLIANSLAVTWSSSLLPCFLLPFDRDSSPV